MTRYIKPLFVFFYLCIVHFLSFGQDNLLNYNNTLQFARFLRSSGQFDFAAEEYERAGFLQPGDSVANIELLQTYRYGNQCNKINQYFNNYQKTHSFEKPDDFAAEYLKSALICKSIQENYFKVSSLFKPEEKAFYELSQFWINREYKKAFAYCNDNTHSVIFKSPELYHLTVMMNSEKKKSPALAALMSALVPGSGKAYSKRWGDALVSFLFVGTNAFTSYRGFSKKGIKSANGWIFGGLALSFYSSGIWGSAKAAQNYNTDIRNKYQGNAEKIIYSGF